MENISLLEGLKITLEPNFIDKNTRGIIFVGEEFLPVFFARWRQKIAKFGNSKFEVFDEELNPLQNFCNYSCFGTVQKKTLWLGSITEIAKPEKFLRLSNTNLSFFCPDAKFEKFAGSFARDNFLIIKIPKIIGVKLLEEILALLAIKFNPARSQILHSWEKNFASINLDQAIQICDYIELLNPSLKDDFALFAQELFSSEEKFFLLPELLFSGKVQNFFTLWEKIKNDFQAPFWTTFWLNSFFKAATIKAGAATPGFSKSLARLNNAPHFKQISLARLKQAIFEIYKIDNQFKQGASCGNLEPVLLGFC